MTRTGECPYCYEDIDNDLFGHFYAHDCPTDFDIPCPHCDKIISVDVRAVPEFDCSQKDPRCPECNKPVKYLGYCKDCLPF